jgi:hypothetical protein
MFILIVVLLVRFSRLQITKPGAPAGSRLMGDCGTFCNGAIVTDSLPKCIREKVSQALSLAMPQA